MDRREFVATLAIGAIAHRLDALPAKASPPQPPADSLPFAAATDIAKLIRIRKVSASEVLDAYLEQIDAHNPAVKAVVTLDRERAVQRAKEADLALARGENWGPLHGVPITLEDAHETAGIRSTWGGKRDFADHVPTQDGTVAARLKAAGAIIIGKTNGPMIWSDSVFEKTNNPWNLEHTPGGSSAGPAAAVAAGMTGFDVGLDTLGSITNPAHYCGVYGMRPTEHRVPLTGVFFIDKVQKWRHMSVTGPMTRSVADIKVVLPLLAGRDGSDSDVPAVAWSEARPMRANELRVAWSAFPGVPMAHDIRERVTALAGELAAHGAHVEERLPPLDLSAEYDLARKLFKVIVSSDGNDGGSLRTYFEVLQQRDLYISGWDRFLTDWDVFLFPAGMITAERRDATSAAIDGEIIPLDQLGRLEVSYAISPVSGCPAIVIPAGNDGGGMPIGVELMARRWNDERLLAIADLVSEMTGGYRRPTRLPPGLI